MSLCHTVRESGFVVEALDQVDQYRGLFIMLKDVPKVVLVYAIKSLFEERKESRRGCCKPGNEQLGPQKSQEAYMP